MKNISDINAIKEKMQAKIIARDSVSGEQETRVVVGMATCGIAAGAKPVFDTLMDEVAKRQLKNVRITRAGCLGMCKLEPIVEVFVPNQPKVTYIRVDSNVAKKIVAEHLVNGNIVQDNVIGNE